MTAIGEKKKASRSLALTSTKWRRNYSKIIIIGATEKTSAQTQVNWSL
jgi:hypothetical protein